jgi:integrase
MSKLLKFLTFEYDSEHDTEHDLPKQKQYSEPKIYDAKGDKSKRWYIYYSYRNPETGKLERQTSIYGNITQEHTKAERLEILTSYRRSLSRLLKKGYNPYDLDTIPEIGEDSVPHVETRVATAPRPKKPSVKKGMLISEAFSRVLAIKKNVVAHATFVNYENKLKKLEQWLEKTIGKKASIEQVTKKHIIDFLNEVLERTSARTRNNNRVELGSLFQAMVDNDIIPINYIHSINVLKTRPERNKTYSDSQQENIYTFLAEKDPILLLFIQFISYNFLRPVEVCRLKIKDVDIKERRLYVRAKNKPVKIKIIPEIMAKLLPDISEMNPEYFLFSPEGFGIYWDANDVNRRDHFTKRFTSVVKKHFKLNKDYGLYSFRHTFITRLYREMIKDSTPFEVKSRIMLITGHSSMVSLEKYLRDIDAALPEDYSDFLKK